MKLKKKENQSVGTLVLLRKGNKILIGADGGDGEGAEGTEGVCSPMEGTTGSTGQTPAELPGTGPPTKEYTWSDPWHWVR